MRPELHELETKLRGRVNSSGSGAWRDLSQRDAYSIAQEHGRAAYELGARAIEKAGEKPAAHERDVALARVKELESGSAKCCHGGFTCAACAHEIRDDARAHRDASATPLDSTSRELVEALDAIPVERRIVLLNSKPHTLADTKRALDAVSAWYVAHSKPAASERKNADAELDSADMRINLEDC